MTIEYCNALKMVSRLSFQGRQQLFKEFHFGAYDGVQHQHGNGLRHQCEDSSEAFPPAPEGALTDTMRSSIASGIGVECPMATQHSHRDTAELARTKGSAITECKATAMGATGHFSVSQELESSCHLDMVDGGRSMALTQALGHSSSRSRT